MHIHIYIYTYNTFIYAYIYIYIYTFCNHSVSQAAFPALWAVKIACVCICIFFLTHSKLTCTACIQNLWLQGTTPVATLAHTANASGKVIFSSHNNLEHAHLALQTQSCRAYISSSLTDHTGLITYSTECTYRAGASYEVE